jgi:hypothetical protein
MRIFCSVALAAVTLAGCAGGMISGQIVSEQGRALDFQIERARRAGRVAAFDPSTGETFAGTYVGILESVGGSRVSIAPHLMAASRLQVLVWDQTLPMLRQSSRVTEVLPLPAK